MMKKDAAHRVVSGVLWGLIVTLLAFGSVHIASAGEPGLDTGIVPEEADPTEQASTPAERETIASPTFPPGESASGDDLSHEGVAPGTVVVSLQTIDGGMVPAGTVICVGGVCQTLSRDELSGIKVDFERMAVGWHEIRASSPVPYNGGSTSVQVWAGQTASTRIVIDLAPQHVSREDETPQQEEAPPPGPIRQVPESQEGSEHPPSQVQVETSQFAATVAVFNLPVTGSGSGVAPDLSMTSLAGAAAFLMLLAVAVRRGRFRR